MGAGGWMSAFSANPSSIYLGFGGGGGSTVTVMGGRGGGAIFVNAREIFVGGAATGPHFVANGEMGESSVISGGAGGGAGGAIHVFADFLSGPAVARFSTSGGNGGDSMIFYGGGAGGFGYSAINFCRRATSTPLPLNVGFMPLGGSGFLGPGEPGTLEPVWNPTFPAPGPCLPL